MVRYEHPCKPSPLLSISESWAYEGSGHVAQEGVEAREAELAAIKAKKKRQREEAERQAQAAAAAAAYQNSLFAWWYQQYDEIQGVMTRVEASNLAAIAAEEGGGGGGGRFSYLEDPIRGTGPQSGRRRYP